MFIFVVMFISCLVYLFNLVLLKIEAVAANESDSGIGAVTYVIVCLGGDSVSHFFQTL